MKSKMRTRFLHATDFQSLMYPCFTFCRILGTFPYKINNSIFKTSKLHYIFSIIITCASCVSSMIFFYYLYIYAKIIEFENLAICIEGTCYMILTGFIAVVTLILSSPRMRLLQTVMDISSRLSPESYQKLSRLIHSKDIFGSFYLISKIFIFFYIVKGNIFFTIYFMYTILLVFTMDMLYINCVCILKACFKEINNDLIHMQEFMVNKESCILTMFYYKQKNLFLIMNIKALEKQHLKISNTVEMLNIIFSLQLLATIVITFSEIIFGLYYHVLRWHNGSINLNKEFSVIYLVFRMYYIMKIALLIWTCETGKNEAQKIRIRIHDVLNSTRDDRIKDELQLFSLQILHCGNTFSAKGLNMDATFLATMTGTITTYILILLQFLIISHSCDGKSAVNIIDNA